jgi:2'-5' RNA ligase
MGSTSLLAATSAELRDHWAWRPEWTPERTCLYWYLAFRQDEIARAVGDEVLEAVGRVPWLDPVPPEWCHVTLADVGFVDELEQADVAAVSTAAAEAVGGEDRLRLTLGPVQTFASAVVLAVGPLSRLRDVRGRVRRATSAVLGERHTDVHRRLLWPHLSLGYVNRRVDAATAARFMATLPPVDARLDVGALTLVAVTRRDRQYQWEVRTQVDLVAGLARTVG